MGIAARVKKKIAIVPRIIRAVFDVLFIDLLKKEKYKSLMKNK